MNERSDINELSAPCITVDWALDGLSFALERGDIIVIVDTLRFSSAVVTAVAHGFIIYPVPDREQGEYLAGETGALLAVPSGEPGISISPLSFVNVPAGIVRKVVLPSPNGAACSACIKQGNFAYIGCFLNARAISDVVTALSKTHKRNVTVIACGEQRSAKNGGRIVYFLEEAHRVFAIEDYLAAGAIINGTSLRRSAEAEVCVRSFLSSQDVLRVLLRDSFSGRYLIENGLSGDIDHAVQLNLYNVVPKVQQGKFVTIN